MYTCGYEPGNHSYTMANICGVSVVKQTWGQALTYLNCLKHFLNLALQKGLSTSTRKNAIKETLQA